MATFTVTATGGGPSISQHIYLLVYVYTNASETGGQPDGHAVATTGNAGGPITPNQSGSAIAWSISQDGIISPVGGLFANNTADYNNSDADSWGTAQGHYTGTVTGGVALNYGQQTNGGAGTDHWNWCAYEITPSGGTPAIDASSPPGVKNIAAAGVSVTTASFTPPPAFVLVAMTCVGGTGTGAGITMGITDTSGLGLIWTQRVTSSSTDNFQPTFIHTTHFGSFSNNVVPPGPSAGPPQLVVSRTIIAGRAGGAHSI